MKPNSKTLKNLKQRKLKLKDEITRLQGEKNGKENFLSFLNSKKIILNYIWETYSTEIKKNDPYAISKFEKKIKSLCYTIKDEVLKKYILEEFLENI